MILICEPVCYNYEHGEVNFSLLQLINLTYDEEIIFIGDSSHIEFIKNLQSNDLKKVTFIYKNNPLIKGNKLNRVLSNFFYFKSIFLFAKNNKINRIFFSAVTIPGIINIKIFSFFNQKCKINIIGHAIFEKLKLKNYKQSSNYIHYIVKYFHPKNLIYIFYGKGNHLKLLKNYKHLKNNIFSFDLPYIFKNNNLNVKIDNKISIGSLGIARIDKGSLNFFHFAKEIKQIHKLTNIEFIQIGKVIDLPYLDFQNFIDFPSPNDSIAYENYLDYNQKINFSIYFYEYNAYSLTVSASFYDSIAFGKPVIAITNPFFDSYFKRFGDIGYLVNNYEELIFLLKNLNNQFDMDRYKIQVNNILNAAKYLSINNVSEYLKTQNI